MTAFQRRSIRHGCRGGLGALAAAVLSLAIGGCGYTWGALLPASDLVRGRPVRVQPVDNRSATPEAGIVATRAMGRAIARQGALGAGAGSDAIVLQGTVTRLDVVPAGVSPPQGVPLWRLDGAMAVELRGPSGGERLASGHASGQELFNAGVDIEATEAARRVAVERLLERLASEAVERLAPVR